MGMYLSFTERWSVYESAVYMAWADERLAPAEVSSARALAEELELDGDGLAPGSVLSAGPPILSDVGVERLRDPARHAAYAIAAWMAFADGNEHPAERAVLSTLRYRMHLDDDTASLLESCAALACALGNATPTRLQLRSLLHALQDVVGSDADQEAGERDTLPTPARRPRSLRPRVPRD